jgi:glycosyltransferase involved in cell wall biosynthesis
MKILHLLQNYYPSIGGTQIFYQRISENLVAVYGDEVEVYTTNSLYGPDKDNFKHIPITSEEINGVKVTRFPLQRWHRPVTKLMAKAIAKLTGSVPEKIQQYNTGPVSASLTNALKNTSADIISASSSLYSYMHYPLWRTQLKAPKPFVFQGAIHFSEQKHKIPFSQKTLDAIKSSEFYMANTLYEKNRLIELGVNPVNIIVAGSAVAMQDFLPVQDNSMSSQFSFAEQDIVAAYIGRLEPTKGLPILLEAFGKAKNNKPQLKLIIAGFKSGYSLELEKIIQQLPDDIRKDIFLIYDLTKSQKRELYQFIHFLILPSVNESFGMVFLEAWASKKPVIGAKIGAIQSVVDDGVDGLLFTPNSATDLSDKIIQLAQSTDLQHQMAMKGYHKTLSCYTWEIITEKYRAVYVEAIKKYYV